MATMNKQTQEESCQSSFKGIEDFEMEDFMLRLWKTFLQICLICF